MKIHIRILRITLLSLVLCSCSGIRINLDEKYQPLGTSVLAANDLLIVKYSLDKPDFIQEEEYKNLLKDNNSPMYNRLIPYTVQINKTGNSFKVKVLDGTTLILTDWLCTEGRIDCWSYNGECTPESIKIECDK